MSEQMIAEQAADIAAYRDGIRSDLAYVARQIRLARECPASMKVHDCLARAADAMERLTEAMEQPIG